MANGYEGRNERSFAGRGASPSDFDYGNRGYGYPDEDRYGRRRSSSSRYPGSRDLYSAPDRDRWTTDDLGYSDYGYADRGDYGGRSFADRERAYARQYDFGHPYRDRPQRDFMDRAGDEVASWFGDEQAARRREMDQFRGRGPKGYKRTDERILEDVNDHLTDAPSLDASDIEVSVSGGEVTLGGFVSSRQDKRHAEDIADDVMGVSHVQNNLRVRGSGETAGDTNT